MKHPDLYEYNPTKANKLILKDLVLEEGDTSDIVMLEIHAKLNKQIEKDGGNYFKYALDQTTCRIALILYKKKQMQELYGKYGQFFF